FFLEISRTLDAPPDPAVERAFPFVDSVVIMDFNRDGLPDVVQGWQSGRCAGPGTYTIISFPSGSQDGPTLDCVQSDPLGGAVQAPIRSARPIPAFINGGNDYFAPNLKFTLRYTCMDAGSGMDGSVPFYNLGKPAGFLVPQGGASVLGAFSEAIVAWE